MAGFGTVVHDDARAEAIVAHAQAIERVLEVVPGRRDAPVRVDGDRRAIRHRPVAPGIVGVEQADRRFIAEGVA
jgi:hypothetical protein